MRSLLVLLLLVTGSRGDSFDIYTNRILARVAEAGKDVKPIKELTPSLIVSHDNVLPRAGAAMLIVRTNGDHFAKLLVLAAKQKAGDGKSVPILQIEKFTTYKEGEDRQILASGSNLALFDGFRLSLDMGQVVPESLGGDLRLVVKEGKTYAEPLGKARLWVLTRHDPALAPRKAGKFVMGDRVEPKHFTGTWKLFDDGRRSGKLLLKSGADGKIVGHYYSDRDGARYDVKGKVGPAPHAVEFSIGFPRVEQVFKGHLFTRGGKALAGTSRLGDRDAAFYAIREE